ncbi:MAG: outer membrane beta-barrel protein [Flavobacteriia bacterium]|nr:outer membrane beta-barrel protein [Flavobacteriia bacterium]
MLKSVFLTFGILVFFQIGFSQIVINGKIIDENQKPIEFVTCLLIEDSVIVDNSLSDSVGNFHLKNNSLEKCFLIFKYLNFEKRIELSTKLDSLYLITINLAKELDEVTIGEKKALIVKSIDRVTFNVENSISSQGLTAYELLKKAPGVRVNNTSISITGKSTVSIYFDDILLKLSGEELIVYLKSIQSDDISKIEVITIPPSKYDAQGNCGIINIVSKKNRKKGFNGSVFSSVAQNNYLSEDLGAIFTLNKNKISFNCNLTMGNSSFKKTENQVINYPNLKWNSDDVFKINYKNIQGSFNFDYNINSKTKMGFSYQNLTAEVDDNGKAKMNLTQNNQIDSIIQTQIDTKILLTIQNANYYVHRDLDTNGKKMSFNFDWLRFLKNDFRELNSSYFNSNNIENLALRNQFENTGLRDANAYTGSLNFDLPLKKITVTTGLKASYLTNKVGFNYINVVDNQKILDTNQSNNFNYNENIEAAYIDFVKELNSWTFKVGLRSEYTAVQILSQKKQSSNSYNYLKLFPTAFIQKNINENNSLTFSYSKRINRPNFYQLNPFRFYNNPYTYLVGDPLIRPEFMHNFEVTHAYAEVLNTTFSYSKLQNGIGWVSNLDSVTYMQQMIFKNCLTSDQFNFNVNYVYDKISWWEHYSEFSYYFVSTKSTASFTVPHVKGVGGYFETNNQFILNKRKTLAAEVAFSFALPSLEGVNMAKSWSSFDFGFRYMMFKNRLKIAINVVDLLMKDKYRFSKISNGININSVTYEGLREIRFSLNYKFGNDKIVKVEKEISNSEERERAK